MSSFKTIIGNWICLFYSPSASQNKMTGRDHSEFSSLSLSLGVHITSWWRFHPGDPRSPLCQHVPSGRVSVVWHSDLPCPQHAASEFFFFFFPLLKEKSRLWWVDLVAVKWEYWPPQTLALHSFSVDVALTAYSSHFFNWWVLFYAFLWSS